MPHRGVLWGKWCMTYLAVIEKISQKAISEEAYRKIFNNFSQYTSAIRASCINADVGRRLKNNEGL